MEVHCLLLWLRGRRFEGQVSVCRLILGRRGREGSQDPREAILTVPSRNRDSGGGLGFRETERSTGIRMPSTRDRETFAHGLSCALSRPRGSGVRGRVPGGGGVGRWETGDGSRRLGVWAREVGVLPFQTLRTSSFPQAPTTVGPDEKWVVPVVWGPRVIAEDLVGSRDPLPLHKGLTGGRPTVSLSPLIRRRLPRGRAGRDRAGQTAGGDERVGVRSREDGRGMTSGRGTRPGSDTPSLWGNVWKSPPGPRVVSCVPSKRCLRSSRVTSGTESESLWAPGP